MSEFASHKIGDRVAFALHPQFDTSQRNVLIVGEIKSIDSDGMAYVRADDGSKYMRDLCALTIVKNETETQP